MNKNWIGILACVLMAFFVVFAGVNAAVEVWGYHYPKLAVALGVFWVLIGGLCLWLAKILYREGR